MPYLCPVCSNSLNLTSNTKSYQCINNHLFDVAKQGYLNLLPVQHKNSKQPGDNKEMLQARRDFLEAGYFANLADLLTSSIAQLTSELPAINLLDLGCGEGYYSRQIANYFAHKKEFKLFGLDISKTAITMAAQRLPIANYAVASNQRLPYSDSYFDLIFRIFAPSNTAEIYRALKPNGLLMTVTPGPRHLWQLKEFIYPEAREHAPIADALTGFITLSSQRLQASISTSQYQRLALLQMTPFAWRANNLAVQAIKNSDGLDIETDFIINVSKKLSTVCNSIPL